MEATLNYTVKKGDGYLTIARFIFSQSHRTYIQTLVNRYDLMSIVAKKIEADLKQQYLNFKLVVGRTLELHADPGHYIASLAVKADHGSPKTKAIKKSTTKVGNDNYFVIHNTLVNYSDTQLKELVSSKKKGAAHAYVAKDGEIYQIWPYNNSNGWATRAEWTVNKPELRGKLIHIELVYKDGEVPTEKQYQALADIYVESKKTFNKWLPIASHREIDRGIKGGHQDPVSFDFEYFYTILENKQVPIKTIKKQSQTRFNQDTYCEHEWVWPPILEGRHFPKVTADVYKTKGCK